VYAGFSATQSIPAEHPPVQPVYDGWPELTQSVPFDTHRIPPVQPVVVVDVVVVVVVEEVPLQDVSVTVDG